MNLCGCFLFIFLFFLIRLTKSAPDYRPSQRSKSPSEASQTPNLFLSVQTKIEDWPEEKGRLLPPNIILKIARIEVNKLNRKYKAQTHATHLCGCIWEQLVVCLEAVCS